jgi:hypothetical protein
MPGKALRKRERNYNSGLKNLNNRSGINHILPSACKDMFLGEVKSHLDISGLHLHLRNTGLFKIHRTITHRRGLPTIPLSIIIDRLTMLAYGRGQGITGQYPSLEMQQLVLARDFLPDAFQNLCNPMDLDDPESAADEEAYPTMFGNVLFIAKLF